MPTYLHILYLHKKIISFLYKITIYVQSRYSSYDHHIVVSYYLKNYPVVAYFSNTQFQDPTSNVGSS